jgi:hypothetical protein
VVWKTFKKNIKIDLSFNLDHRKYKQNIYQLGHIQIPPAQWRSTPSDILKNLNLSSDLANIGSNVKYSKEIYRDVEKENLAAEKIKNQKYGKTGFGGPTAQLSKLLHNNPCLGGLDSVIKNKLVSGGKLKGPTPSNSNFWAAQMGDEGDSGHCSSKLKLVPKRRG